MYENEVPLSDCSFPIQQGHSDQLQPALPTADIDNDDNDDDDDDDDENEPLSPLSPVDRCESKPEPHLLDGPIPTGIKLVGRPKITNILRESLASLGLTLDTYQNVGHADVGDSDGFAPCEVTALVMAEAQIYIYIYTYMYVHVYVCSIL